MNKPHAESTVLVPASPAASTQATGHASQTLLSTSQDVAIEWLAGGSSISDAAQAAGVCRQTVSTWLRNDPDFQAVLHSWREQTLALARDRLTAMTEAALDTLNQAVSAKHDVRAAQFVLRQMGVGVASEVKK